MRAEARPWGRLTVAAVALALAAPLLVSCSSDAGSGPVDTGHAAIDGTAVLLPPGERGAPVDLTGTTLAGKALDLASWRGQVVVVNFWGSWCVTCRNEAGSLERSYQDLHSSGVQFLGIATRDTLANAQAFQRAYPVSYPSLLDDPASNPALLAFRGELPVASTPTTYVLDRRGRIAARALNEVTTERVRALVDPVLAEKS